MRVSLPLLQVQARKEERELVISGERPAPEQAEGDAGFRRRFERRFGKFSRTFSVSAPRRSLAVAFLACCCSVCHHAPL